MTETGWLIELVSRLGLPPTWFAFDDDSGYFTADSLKALRFARKQDAQAYIDDVGWTECIATEHEWSDAKATAAMTDPTAEEVVAFQLNWRAQ